MEAAPAGPARFLRTQHLVAALIPVLIFVLAITGFVWAQKGVTVVVDGESRYIKTQAEDIAGLLDEADIAYAEGDVVSPVPDTVLEDGMSVVVRHAIPVRIQTSDEMIEIGVVGNSVADALTAAGIDPAASCVVDPALDAPLASGMTIDVSNVFVRVIEEREEIPYETVTRNDATAASGSREVVTEGVPGTMLRIYRVVVTDEVEGERTLVTETIVQDPVDEIVSVGTKRTSTQVTRSSTPVNTAAAPPAGGTKLTVSSTAYAPGVDGVGTRTATGAAAGYGIVAVDPSVIPLGTRLYIPGYGYGVAADTGGAIRGNKIDVCFNTRSEALAWGRRTVTITILP